MKFLIVPTASYNKKVMEFKFRENDCPGYIYTHRCIPIENKNMLYQMSNK